MNTNDKGTIGLTATLASLAKLGYTAFLPVSEHSVVDVIAYKDNVVVRLQVKHSSNGLIRNCSTYSRRNGVVREVYNDTDFDYYAVYIPEIDKVCYIPSCLGGKQIRWRTEQLPSNNQDILWFEDYLDITPDAIKLRRTSDLVAIEQKPRLNRRKPRPSADELTKLLEESPASVVAEKFQVSGRMVGKWAKEYGIPTKPRGYWTDKTRH